MHCTALWLLLGLWEKRGEELRPALYAVLSAVGFQKLTYATSDQNTALCKVEGFVAERRGEVLTTLLQVCV